MIAIIKYNSGNSRSVANALARLGQDSVLTDNEATIRKASHVIFPGVGAAGPAMQYLKSKALDELIVELRQPFLGICLGLQLMCSYSEENNTDCLDIFPANVKKFETTKIVPHMGWNSCGLSKQMLKTTSHSRILAERTKQDFYFVHSYAAEICVNTTATCDYIHSFSAVLEKDNFFATQFHPEKSANAGMQLLQKFITL